MEELHDVLDTCDNDCPFMHFNRQGHPLPCHSGKECRSNLRILHAVSVHFRKLPTFLSYLYSARKSHCMIQRINEALCSADIESLLLICVTNLQDLFGLSNDDATVVAEGSSVRQVSEKELNARYVVVIHNFLHEVEDDPE